MCMWNRFVHGCGHAAPYLEIEVECNAVGRMQIQAYEKSDGFPEGLECPPKQGTTHSRPIPTLCQACWWDLQQRQRWETSCGVEEKKHHQEGGYEEWDNAEEGPMNNGEHYQVGGYEEWDHAGEGPMNNGDWNCNEMAPNDQGELYRTEETPGLEGAHHAQKALYFEEGQQQHRETSWTLKNAQGKDDALGDIDETPYDHPWYRTEETPGLEGAHRAQKTLYFKEGQQQNQEACWILKKAQGEDDAVGDSDDTPYDPDEFYQTEENPGSEGAHRAKKARYSKEGQQRKQKASGILKNAQAEEDAPGDNDETSTNVQEPLTGEKEPGTSWTYLGDTGSYA